MELISLLTISVLGIAVLFVVANAIYVVAISWSDWSEKPDSESEIEYWKGEYDSAMEGWERSNSKWSSTIDSWHQTSDLLKIKSRHNETLRYATAQVLDMIEADSGDLDEIYDLLFAALYRNESE